MKRKSVYRSALSKAKKRRVLNAYRSAPSRTRVPSRTLGQVNLGRAFPNKATVKQRYVDQVSITSTTGVIGTYRFSANGLYDPNITGTGHQPYLFDQFTGLYNHYCVVASRILVEVIPTTASTASALVALAQNDDTSATYTTAAEMSEQTTGKAKFLTVNATDPVYLSSSWNLKKVFGGDPLSNNALQGTVTGNPTEQTYFDIGIQCTGASTGSYSVRVVIEYDVIWSEVKDVAAS